MREVIAEKLAASGRNDVTAIPFDLTAEPPSGEPFDLAISLLVLHHVADTATALAAIRALLAPGGRIAIADLDTEDGTFHDPDAEGIHHHGFDREKLGELARDAGFVDVESAPRSRSSRRTGTSRCSCCWAGTRDSTRDDRGQRRGHDRRRPSRRRSTGRAGHAPARPRNWPSRRSPTTRRATRSSRRRPASRSRRRTTRSSSGPAAGAAPNSASRPRSRSSMAGRSTQRRRYARHVSSRRRGRSSRASPPERPPSSAKGPAAVAGTATRWSVTSPNWTRYYAREIGISGKRPEPTDGPAIEAMRAEMLEILRQPSDGSPLAERTWTARYGARRIAWHALDHAWEMEDRACRAVSRAWPTGRRPRCRQPGQTTVSATSDEFAVAGRCPVRRRRRHVERRAAAVGPERDRRFAPTRRVAAAELRLIDPQVRGAGRDLEGEVRRPPGLGRAWPHEQVHRHPRAVRRCVHHAPRAILGVGAIVQRRRRVGHVRAGPESTRDREVQGWTVRGAPRTARARRVLRPLRFRCSRWR